MINLRKSLLACAIGAAVASPAAFAGNVWFDTNGALGANTAGVDRFLVSSFDWNVGNVLATNSTVNDDADITRILSQATLSTINRSNGGTFSYTTGELTFQMSVRAVATVDPTGTGSVEWTDAGSDLDNYFDIYYDTGADTNGVNSTSGCGFGSHSDGVGACGADDSLHILRARVTLSAMNWDADDTQSNPLPLLDSFGADNQNGIRTLAAQGNGSFDLEVISFDPAFFFQGGLSALGVDIDFSNQNPDPFNAANPTDVVVDTNVGTNAAARTAAYGSDGINNVGLGSCGGGGGGDNNCDLHMQGDSNMSFNAVNVPEPASLALIGAGLLGAGAFRRFRKA